MSQRPLSEQELIEWESSRELMVEINEGIDHMFANIDPKMIKLNELLDNTQIGRKYNPNSFDNVTLLSYFASNRLALKYWKALFILTFRCWGFNNKSSAELFEWGFLGHNWTKLHPTTEENNMTANEVLLLFYGEVGYCSDRMSFDRIFRCHWLYHHYLNINSKIMK